MPKSEILLVVLEEVFQCNHEASYIVDNNFSVPSHTQVTHMADCSDCYFSRWRELLWKIERQLRK